MKNQMDKKIGGVIYKCKDLLSIVMESDCVGLTFSLEKPGYSPHLNLKVYKVINKGEHLFGKLRSVNYCEGANTYDSSPQDLKNMNFEHLKELKRCGFYFAFLEKKKFLDLIENGEPEVFLSGAVKDYGNSGPIKGKWFSLKITTRKDTTLETLDMGIAPPEDFFIPPCPPIWRKGITEEESMMDELNIVFSKALHLDEV